MTDRVQYSAAAAGRSATVLVLQMLAVQLGSWAGARRAGYWRSVRADRTPAGPTTALSQARWSSTVAAL